MRGWTMILRAVWPVLLLAGPGADGRRAEAAAKTGSVFCPPALVAAARANIRRDAWAAQAGKLIVEAAGPWMKLTDEELWDGMFGPTIRRSWMVWSNGHCPSCRKGVPMYNWEMDALARPWKVHCPHCKESFPKNDFLAFYRSGQDEHGLFDPARADRRLLFHVDHPDPDDPQHLFGVDDGEGYVEGDRRWRFIGAYLIYGQWKQFIVGGIRNLAAAYVVTGEPACAHKAGVLLDRVADVYPTFDFSKEGVMYEGPPSRGYVSTWHDACVEVRDLVLAYDQVFEALSGDAALVGFLSGKARQFKFDNPKASFADVQRNIEQRIFRDALAHRPKIESNYPQTDMTITLIETALDWPGNREKVMGMIGKMVETATAVDGLSGEKGLAGYSVIAPHTLAELLGRYARVDAGFLGETVKRYPRLHEMYRFHLDTWCLEKYYPLSGDTGSFACRCDQYVGVPLSKTPGIGPSGYRFLWSFYEATGDPDFVRLLYRANGNGVDGLPYDLFADDVPGFQARVRETIAAAGPAITLGSVSKQRWHLAILRSGEQAHARAVWLDYDSGERHSHADGMNLGLFAKGLDLMPDFGYPPVQFGGWGSPRARWYTMTAAHNTVVVDGKDQAAAGGRTRLWADGRQVRAIRASAPELAGAQQYERTVAMIDVSPQDFYVVDVFRIVGGTDHAKFMHSHFSHATPHGLSLAPGEEYGHGTQMRHFQTDVAAQPGWSVDFTIEDRYQYLPRGADVHLRYTDLTVAAQVSIAEGWVVPGIFDSTQEAWIPRVMVRRRAEKGPLASTFVAVIEPHEGPSKIDRIRRLPVQTLEGRGLPDSHVAVEVGLADGRRDLLVAPDVEAPRGSAPAADGPGMAVRDGWSVQVQGELCTVRCRRDGSVERVGLARGRSVTAGEVVVALTGISDFIEVGFDGHQVEVLAGDPRAVREILVKGQRVLPR